MLGIRRSGSRSAFSWISRPKDCASEAAGLAGRASIYWKAYLLETGLHAGPSETRRHCIQLQPFRITGLPLDALHVILESRNSKSSNAEGRLLTTIHERLPGHSSSCMYDECNIVLCRGRGADLHDDDDDALLGIMRTTLFDCCIQTFECHEKLTSSPSSNHIS